MKGVIMDIDKLKNQVKREFPVIKIAKKNIFIIHDEGGWEILYNTKAKERDESKGFLLKRMEVKSYQSQPALAEYVAMKARIYFGMED